MLPRYNSDMGNGTARTLIAYHRLGDRNGRKRVYLESQAVSAAGFAPGDRYAVHVDEAAQTITICRDERGARHITRRQRSTGAVIPVVDVTSEAIDSLARRWERARVEFGADTIVLRVHRDHSAEAERLRRLRDRLASGERLAVASLCTGIGALDHAIVTGLRRELVDAEVRVAVENNPRVLEATLANNDAVAQNAVAIFGRLQDVEPQDLGRADVLIAGIPCTGASLAGRAARAGAAPEEHPDAGTVFLSYIDAIVAANPAVAVLENVPSYRNTAGMLAIRAALELRGYTVHERIVDGPAFGDLEARRRLCMVAVTHGITIELDALVPVREKPARLGDVLIDLPDDSERWKYRDGLERKNAKADEKGTNFRLQIVDADAETIPTMTAGYARMRGCEPLIDHPTKPGFRRTLTPAEHAAAKGIPFALVADLSECEQHEALGNAVTYHAFVSVGAAIGASLRAFAARDERSGEQAALFGIDSALAS